MAGSGNFNMGQGQPLSMDSEMAYHIHLPVMVDDVVDNFGAIPKGFIVDATLGLGGHSFALLRSNPDISVLGIDADQEALEIARERLSEFDQRCILKHGNYTDMHTIAKENGVKQVSGVLMDLGLSSLQLACKGRGFSFIGDGPLDMRFDQSTDVSASDIVNKYSEKEIADILFQFGEEKKSRRIANQIVRNRPVSSTSHLVTLIQKAVGNGAGRLHPATRTFQALRIAVNRELENVKDGLKAAVDLVGSGGKIIILSYHSLEDRIVKNFLRNESKGCICPSEIIVCRCAHVPKLVLKHKKVLKPSAKEVIENPRSRSVRLRIAEKV